MQGTAETIIIEKSTVIVPVSTGGIKKTDRIREKDKI